MKVHNMDQVEAWSGGAILPAGTHYVRLDSVAEGESTGGHPQLEIEFVSEQGVGSIRDWLVVNEATYGKVRQLLDACGVEPEGGEWELPLDRLKDSKLYIVVQDVPKFDDPTEDVRKVVEYKAFSADDLPVAAGGMGERANDDIPF